MGTLPVVVVFIAGSALLPFGGSEYWWIRIVQ